MPFDCLEDAWYNSLENGLLEWKEDNSFKILGGVKMDTKMVFSQLLIDLLDSCMGESENWSFDAINSPLLIREFMYDDDAGLGEYAAEKNVDEEAILAFLDSHSGLRRNLLRENKETDKKNEGENQAVEEEEDKYRSEHDTDLVFVDEKGNEGKYPIAEEVRIIFEKANEICAENHFKVMEPIHVLVAMFTVDDPTLRSYLEDLCLNYRQAKKEFTKKDIFKTRLIPYSLSGFLSCMNSKVNTKKPCEILMRDKEVEQIWNICLKKNKRNTAIVGDAGVGKTALVEKMVYELEVGTCPERFKDYVIYSLDVNALIAGTTLRGQTEERIKTLIQFLEEQDNAILFIDELHTILGAGACKSGEMDFANALKPTLARGDIIVIGATTLDEYEKYIMQDSALSRRFEKIVVEEPKAHEVYPMIKNKIQALSEFHHVKISRSMVEYAIMIANCFAFEKKNPDKTLDLIDRSMVVASRKKKKSVDKNCILANYQIFYELYDGNENEHKKVTAYHEVGHYLIGKFSPRLEHLQMLAVSIMPAEWYLGVTCYEQRKDKMPFKNKDFYIDMLAFHLGGRVAENIFTKDFTSGAGQDLNNATRLAFDVITKCGLGSEEGTRNSIFLNTEDYPMLSEKSTNLVNSEVQKLIELAYQRALSIIEERKELLEVLVNQLLKTPIMSEMELDCICKQYMKEKCEEEYIND